MVAVGNPTVPGDTTAQTATTQLGILRTPMPQWRVRDGRGDAFTLWDDALGDVLASLRVSRSDIRSLPPELPTGVSLSSELGIAYRHALDQYQTEGTLIFDAVRPSLIVDGPYSTQDIKRISRWKRDGVKDGRALLRWALGFVDRKSLRSQMQLVSEINGMKLSAAATHLQLTQHLFAMYDLWLELDSSDPSRPASFFTQLLISMPTAPEGPIVHVRRWLVDLVDKGDSPLLADIDGDEGLFARMTSYATSLGLKEATAGELHAFNPGGGGATIALETATAMAISKASRVRGNAMSASHMLAKGKAAAASASTTPPSTSTRSSRMDADSMSSW